MADRCFEPIVFDKKTCVQPEFVIQIEGFDCPITSGVLKDCITLNSGICLDEDFELGQLIPKPDLIKAVTLDDEDICLDDGLCIDELFCKPGYLDCLAHEGFTSNITQKLDPSRSSTSSISNFKMRVLDTDCRMSKLYSRGKELKDILNTRVDVYVSFCGNDIVFPDEYKKIFRGFVTSVCSGPGYVDFVIDHPDKRKQQGLFSPYKSTLANSINDASTTNVSINPVPNQDLKLPGDCLRTAVYVENEVIEYTGYTVGADGDVDLSGVTRNSDEFSSLCPPESLIHAVGEDVGSLCILEGNPIDIALKLMRSGSSEPGPYNTLPEGLGLDIDDVDISRHEEIRDTYLETAFVRIYLTEETDAKSLIEEQLYKPFGLYSVPRDTKSSINYFQPPIYPDTVPVFDKDCVVTCSRLKINRSLNVNFTNQVLYKYDKSWCEDEYFGGVLSLNQESIDCYQKRETFEICSDGLRSEFGAQNLATDASLRRLDRFAFAAEYINDLEVFFQPACNVEIGDTIALNLEGLNVTESSTGKRDFTERLFEVVNKKFNVKTGRAFFDLIDTGFRPESTDIRFASVAPCSKVTAYGSGQYNLDPSPCFDGDEVEKWCVGDKITIRNNDYSICEETTIVEIGANGIRTGYEAPLGEDCLFIELANYGEGQTECTELRFAYISDSDNNFSDGTIPYTVA